jgi:hypothetical protein
MPLSYFLSAARPSLQRENNSHGTKAALYGFFTNSLSRFYGRRNPMRAVGVKGLVF